MAQYLTEENLEIVQTDVMTGDKDYARFLYYGKLMVSPSTGSAWAKPGEVKRPTQKDLKYSQAGTGPEWFEKWKGADGDAAVRRVLEAWTALYEGRQP